MPVVEKRMAAGGLVYGVAPLPASVILRLLTMIKNWAKIRVKEF